MPKNRILSGATFFLERKKELVIEDFTFDFPMRECVAKKELKKMERLVKEKHKGFEIKLVAWKTL